MTEDDRIATLEKELRNCRRDQKNLHHRLLRLTPGGSEFTGSPNRCLDFIKDRMSTVMEVAKERNHYRDLIREAQVVMAAPNSGRTGHVWLEIPQEDYENINGLRREQIMADKQPEWGDGYKAVRAGAEAIKSIVVEFDGRAGCYAHIQMGNEDLQYSLTKDGFKKLVELLNERPPEVRKVTAGKDFIRLTFEYDR